MAYKDVTQSAKDVFSHQTTSVINPQTHGERRQDKDRISSDRVGTEQPASVNKVSRSQPLNPNGTRTHSLLVHRSRTEHLNVWINPLVKAELEQLAEQEGLSLSATIAAFLERSLQAHVDLQYSALLEPIIKAAIRKELQGMSNRFAWLLTRNIFASEQTRTLVTTMLGKQPGVSRESLKAIVEMSTQAAKGNLRRRNPELEDLIARLKEWLDTEEGEETHG